MQNNVIMILLVTEQMTIFKTKETLINTLPRVTLIIALGIFI